MKFFKEIDPIVKDLEAVDFYLYTDGNANYPQEEIIKIKDVIEDNIEAWKDEKDEAISKLSMYLMCDTSYASNLETVALSLNKVFQEYGMKSGHKGDICQVNNQVELS